MGSSSQIYGTEPVSETLTDKEDPKIKEKKLPGKEKSQQVCIR